MKFILSPYGGRIEPKDHKIVNKLYAYPESYAALLKENDVEVCGSLEYNIDCNDKLVYRTNKINKNKNYFELQKTIYAAGNNLRYETSPLVEGLKSIQKEIQEKHGLDLNIKTLFQSKEVNVNLFITQYQNGDEHELVGIDKNESIESIIKSKNTQGNADHLIERIKNNELIGEMKVPIKFFRRTNKQNILNSYETLPGIIFVNESRYENFWTNNK